MSDNQTPTSSPGEFTRDELMSGLFASLVMQQTNMALMMLGKGPPQEGGEPFQDMDSARVFIDQLEMLKGKTRGNLSRDEEKLLNQNLTALRMAFVEAAESQGNKPTPAESPAPAEGRATAGTSAAGEQAGSQAASAAVQGSSTDVGGAAEESRKKFSKKY